MSAQQNRQAQSGLLKLIIHAAKNPPPKKTAQKSGRNQHLTSVKSLVHKNMADREAYRHPVLSDKPSVDQNHQFLPLCNEAKTIAKVRFGLLFCPPSLYEPSFAALVCTLALFGKLSIASAESSFAI
jgi:hypothetical protein